MRFLTFRSIDLFIILSSIAIMIAFSIFIKKSKMGIAMRATAENLEVANMMGIEINKVISVAFILGSAIAAFTGFLWGAKYGQISYDMGFLTGVKAFVAVVVGGWKYTWSYVGRFCIRCSRDSLVALLLLDSPSIEME